MEKHWKAIPGQWTSPSTARPVKVTSEKIRSSTLRLKHYWITPRRGQKSNDLSMGFENSLDHPTRTPAIHQQSKGHTSASRLDKIPPNHLLLLIIRPFHQHVRAYRADQ